MPVRVFGQPVKLLQKDGWKPGRKAKHGRCLTKRMPSGRTRVTFVPEMRASLPDGTLSAILSEKQTGIGKDGLRRLIERYGVK
ncbi:MAG: hypothetical protein FJ005_00585 [Chloroflexi bacterium]|nr:hypothetical protein [Chloroflexota bacterium]